MADSVEQVFSRTAATYDQDRARLIPGFDAFYATAVAQVPEGAQRILDLGAGTGLLSAFVRERLPNARLHLIDSSAAMLTQAQARFAGIAQMTFQVDDYTAGTLGEGYDAVVSALSIHHLPNAAKRALFTRIYRALRPGGAFVNAEQILQPQLEQEAAAKQQWLADVRALGASEAQVEASLLRQTEDRCATVADQLRWLGEAGFQCAQCFWQMGRFAVLSACRPPL